MKKLLFILAIARLQAAPSFCQTNFPNNSLSISIGPCFPIGNFSQTEPSNDLAGFAKVGQSINISYGYKLNNHFGLVGMLYGQRNGLNTKAMAKEYAKAKFFPTKETYRRYPNWKVNKSSWLTGSVLVGFSGNIEPGQSRKVSLVAKALTGLVYVRAPKISANSKTDTSYTELKRDKTNGIGQSFLISGGVKYATSKRTGVTLSCEYFSTSQVKFKNVKETVVSTDGGLIIPGLHSFANSRSHPISYEHSGNLKQPVSSINLNIGFVFLL